jgi:hypothetical protein
VELAPGPLLKNCLQVPTCCAAATGNGIADPQMPKNFFEALSTAEKEDETKNAFFWPERFINNSERRPAVHQGCQIFSWKNVPSEHKMYQMVIKCPKCP